MLGLSVALFNLDLVEDMRSDSFLKDLLVWKVIICDTFYFCFESICIQLLDTYNFGNIAHRPVKVHLLMEFFCKP